MKKTKILTRIIAMVLCAAILFSSNGICYTAMAKEVFSSHKEGGRKAGKYNVFHEEPGYEKTVYMDGIKFKVRITQDSTVIIEGRDNGKRIRLEYSSDGIGSVMVGEQEYLLDINSLTDDKVDISVSDKGKKIYEYKGRKGEFASNYYGQAVALPIAVPAAKLLIALAIAALVALGIVAVIEAVETDADGREWYDAVDAVQVIEEEKKLKDKYYLARQSGDLYLIALYAPLTEIQATSIVQTEIYDLYTFNAKNAYDIIIKAGYAVEGGDRENPDHHFTSGTQFPHFHKEGHNLKLSKFHSLYGTPTRISQIY